MVQADDYTNNGMTPDISCLKSDFYAQGSLHVSWPVREAAGILSQPAVIK